MNLVKSSNWILTKKTLWLTIPGFCRFTLLTIIHTSQMEIIKIVKIYHGQGKKKHSNVVHQIKTFDPMEPKLLQVKPKIRFHE